MHGNFIAMLIYILGNNFASITCMLGQNYMYFAFRGKMIDLREEQMQSPSSSTMKLRPLHIFENCCEKERYVSFGCEMPGSCVSCERLRHAKVWEYLLNDRAGSFSAIKHLCFNLFFE